MRLSAHGITAELPPGWSGRVFRRTGGNATLHAASFPLVLDDGEFGDASTARMAPGASFVSLTEYLPGAGLRARPRAVRRAAHRAAPGPDPLLDPRPGPSPRRARRDTSSSSPPPSARSACTWSSPGTGPTAGVSCRRWTGSCAGWSSHHAELGPPHAELGTHHAGAGPRPTLSGARRGTAASLCGEFPAMETGNSPKTREGAPGPWISPDPRAGGRRRVTQPARLR